MLLLPAYLAAWLYCMIWCARRRGAILATRDCFLFVLIRHFRFCGFLVRGNFVWVVGFIVVLRCCQIKRVSEFLFDGEVGRGEVQFLHRLESSEVDFDEKYENICF
jgi:hypothetical protein